MWLVHGILLLIILVTFEEEWLPKLLFKFYLQGPGIWKTMMSQEVVVVINGGVRLFLAFCLNRKKNFAAKYLLVVFEQCLNMGFQVGIFPALLMQLAHLVTWGKHRFPASEWWALLSFAELCKRQRSLLCFEFLDSLATQWHKCPSFIDQTQERRGISAKLFTWPSSYNVRNSGWQALFCQIQACDSGRVSSLCPQCHLPNGELHGGFMTQNNAAY